MIFPQGKGCRPPTTCLLFRFVPYRAVLVLVGISHRRSLPFPPHLSQSPFLNVGFPPLKVLVVNFHRFFFRTSLPFLSLCASLLYPLCSSPSREPRCFRSEHASLSSFPFAGTPPRFWRTFCLIVSPFSPHGTNLDPEYALPSYLFFQLFFVTPSEHLLTTISLIFPVLESLLLPLVKYLVVFPVYVRPFIHPLN